MEAGSYATPTAAGEAARSTQRGPVAPIASRLGRVGEQCAHGARRTPRDRRAATATPPPDCAEDLRHRGAGSIAATTGRAAARIEYVFDGTLTRAEAALERHDVHVAGGEQLGQSRSAAR